MSRNEQFIDDRTHILLYSRNGDMMIQASSIHDASHDTISLQQPDFVGKANEARQKQISNTVF